MAKSEKKYFSEFPLTSEAREKFVVDLFDTELPHQGEVFLPDDDFYIHSSPHQKAENMINLLGKWLGIKPGYIGLAFESEKIKKKNIHKFYISINQITLSDEFILGAKIAYELARYLVEERKQILPSQSDQRSALLANATIEFGLGLVILNGIKPKRYIKMADKDTTPDILQGFSKTIYSQMIISFSHKYRIDRSRYVHCLTPWSADNLYLKLTVYLDLFQY